MCTTQLQANTLLRKFLRALYIFAYIACANIGTFIFILIFISVYPFCGRFQSDESSSRRPFDRERDMQVTSFISWCSCFCLLAIFEERIGFGEKGFVAAARIVRDSCLCPQELLPIDISAVLIRVTSSTWIALIRGFWDACDWK